MISDNFIDQLITRFDATLRVISGTQMHSTRKYPAQDIKNDKALNQQEKKLSASLMRINHAGEIAAQGLYHGQAISAYKTDTKNAMLENAHDETDHLEWCRKRVEQLDAKVSVLTPFWYFGSVAIGTVAGIFGDRISHAFVRETEEQVVEHLQAHLSKLPRNDRITRAIIEQIQIDEREHAENAGHASDYHLPQPIKSLMRCSARIMTTTARWI